MKQDFGKIGTLDTIVRHTLGKKGEEVDTEKVCLPQIRKMDEYGRIAVLVDGNDDYFYYYQLDEERVVRVTEDGIAQINPYWDIDVLTEDLEWLMKDRGYHIEYMDDDIVDYYLENKDNFDEFVTDKKLLQRIKFELKKYKEEK